MTVETETLLTQKEYAKLILKFGYRQQALKIVIFAGVCSFIFLLLNWLHLVNIFSRAIQMILLFLVVVNIFLPFTIYSSAQKQHDHNKRLQQNFKYIFDDEKISDLADGMEGYMTWVYILKYQNLDNFLVLHTGSNMVFFIKTDMLSDGDIKFIISKIKTE